MSRATWSAARPARPKRSRTAAIPPTSGSTPSSPHSRWTTRNIRACGARRAASRRKQVRRHGGGQRRADCRRGHPPGRGAARRRAANDRPERRLSWCRTDATSVGRSAAMNRTTGTQRRNASWDLVTADVTLAGRRRSHRHHGADRRQPRRRARHPVCGACRERRPTARASSRMRSAAARWRCWPRSTRRRCAARTSPVIRVDDPRRALALTRGAVLSAPARAARRGHRHQRQDLGRGFPPPDLRRRRSRGGEHRHDRRRQPAVEPTTAA